MAWVTGDARRAVLRQSVVQEVHAATVPRPRRGCNSRISYAGDRSTWIRPDASASARKSGASEFPLVGRAAAVHRCRWSAEW
jgi:hypothetical protein